jgi:ABC-type phosphate transport system auxiliary subunit
MPVTARLSQAFYDRFGEQVTNELVEWFNQVDLTYRTDLRTLNDTNFARFEALLESRFARADLQLERQLNERFGEFEQRTQKRFGVLEQRIDGVEKELRLLREQLRRDQLEQLCWITGVWTISMVGLFAVLAPLIRQG